MSRIVRTLTIVSLLALAGCSRGSAPSAEPTQNSSASAVGAEASPTQVVEQHVDAMKTGDLAAIMSDYADDVVVIAPEGLVKDQTPATGPGVFAGAEDAKRVFATLTAPGSLDAIKGMDTRVEAKGDEVVFLYWTQFKGQPNEVSGRDVFVVRNSKIVFQDIIPNPE